MVVDQQQAPTPLTLWVKYNDISLDVQTTDKIEHVKTKVRELADIPESQQFRLKYCGLSLPDSTTLALHGIPNDATLHLDLLAGVNEIYVQIGRDPNKKVTLTDIQLTDTIATVKKKVEEQEGCSGNLVFRGKIVDDACKLAQLGFEMEMTLHLVNITRTC
eukprot:TRINITY_DN85002_c0_g1_i1.p2 TRINITY_DN85002_c0_g1~~TRINITY_DN85002_c0_g1_i1.p2  ORF type:complete len:161 (+),score=24.09 TRINITY_DN85002_c0_g1_i1:288-770(+)